MFKRAVKLILLGLSQLVVFPAAAIAAFGKWKEAFTLFAHSYALIPGLPGDYLRTAYYHLTLRDCPLSGRVSYGTFFAHPEAEVGPDVYIGSYCVFGKTAIGARSQIATGVQILSGKHQHSRDEAGNISGSERGAFEAVTIGSDCWIGAGAIVMAHVGARTTIGAGAVVTRPIPADCVAVGNPARVLESGTGRSARHLDPERLVNPCA